MKTSSFPCTPGTEQRQEGPPNTHPRKPGPGVPGTEQQIVRRCPQAHQCEPRVAAGGRVCECVLWMGRQCHRRPCPALLSAQRPVLSQSAVPPLALTRTTPQQSCCFPSSLNGTGIAHSLCTSKRQASGAIRNQVNKVKIQTQACACRSTQFTDRLKALATQVPQGRVTGGRPPSPLRARTRTRGNTARKQGCPRRLDQRQTTRTAQPWCQPGPQQSCSHVSTCVHAHW